MDGYLVVRRTGDTLLGVDLPPGAREVRLRLESSPYAQRKMFSVVAVLLAVATIPVPVAWRRTVTRWLPFREA